MTPNSTVVATLRTRHILSWTAAATAVMLSGCGGGASAPAAIPSHALGGSISGLSSSGLTIANGSDSLAVAAGATTFTMPGMVQTGAAYALTVKSQPSGQQCSFANGAGTMPDADMRNAVLTCATQTVGLAGTISGLSAVGLVLANGSDTITLSPGANTFTLPAVAAGGSWNITVKNQPAGQVCTIVNGNGQAGSSAAANIQVSCVTATTSHALAGSVSGLLSGGSVVLANGSDTISVSANGGFTFSQPVASGANYSVAVQTPPVGQSCTVGSGSGTMGTADVGNVTVSCSANTYTLGGTITGLSAAGLILANGSDVLNVAANAGLFTMGQPVAYGASYALLINTQPAGLRCTTSNNAGTMGSANVSSIMIGCVAAPLQVSTFAGTGVSGYLDGSASVVQFSGLTGIVSDASGNFYVSDYGNRRIRRIASDGTVSTFAGSGVSGSADGVGTAAEFSNPVGLAIDSTGNIFVADQNNYRIRKIQPDGTVSTFAGSTRGTSDGVGTAAQFQLVYGLAFDNAGNLIVSEYGISGGDRIRKIQPDGTVSTVAGNSTSGNADGNGTAAQFSRPVSVTVDSANNIFVADTGNYRIRKIAPDGTVTTFAGSTSGYVDGNASAAKFGIIYGLKFNSAGELLVADSSNNRIRKIAADGAVSTLAGSGASGSADGDASVAQFKFPFGFAFDATGSLLVTEYQGYKVRKIQP